MSSASALFRKARAGLRHPALAHGALRHGGSVLGVAVEDGEDSLLHLERRRAARVLDLGEAWRLVVRRRLARGEDRLVHRPRAGVREHGLLQQLGARVHECHGVDRARRASGRVRIRAFAHADARPTLGLVALERVDGAPIDAAVRVPVHGVRMRGHPGGVEADRGVEVVVESRRRVDRLRAADLLRRLAEEDERAREAVALQRLLGGEHPAERSRPERRVGVGVAGRLLVHGLREAAGTARPPGCCRGRHRIRRTRRGRADRCRSSPGTLSACRRYPPRPRSRAREGAARSARPTGTRARPARGSPRSSVSSARASCGARRPTRAPCASARSDHAR